MEYVRLPGTDLSVSRIGFGAEPLGGTDWGQLDEREAVGAVERALDLGVTVFDTADIYGLGRSEEVLSRALGGRRHEVVIVSKFGVNWQTDPAGGRARTFLDSSPARVREALEGSLRRLRIETLPLYLIHWPDPKTPLEATLEALLQAKEEGLIRHVGVSNFSADLLREAHLSAPLTVNEVQYNLIDRKAEETVFPLCQEFGIGVFAYGPLAQGLLTGKYDASRRFGDDDRRHRLPHFQGARLQENLRLVERLKELANAHGRTPAQVALNWILANPAVSCAITGAKTPEQMSANVGALGFGLTQEERRYLEDRNPVHQTPQRTPHVTS